MEFARRLKSLENEFRREYESGKRTLKSKCIFSKRKQGNHDREDERSAVVDAMWYVLKIAFHALVVYGAQFEARFNFSTS